MKNEIYNAEFMLNIENQVNVKEITWVGYQIDNILLFTIIIPKMIPTKISEISKGCGKPEINSKTGNINITCGDSLDERYNKETGDLEFYNWLCPTCQAKLSATKETYLMMIDDEITYLEKQIRMIDVERDLAEKANTNNGRQSLLMLWMWRTQDVKRLSALQKQREELTNG